MPQVQTVRGPVDTAELGQTLMHEHVFTLTADVQQNYPEEWGSEDERVADAVEKLTALSAVGVRTIVDPTVIGLGRYIPRIQRIAEQIDLNIVVATGCYTYDDVPFFFHHRGPALNAAVGAEVPDPMVDMFVRDITEGIAGTGVRAAFLKCAIDEPGLTPGVERVMRAVAKAHQRTGAPITVHTHPGNRTGLDVQRVFGEEGVDRDPAPMMVAEDFSYMLAARPGAYIFMGNGDSAGLHHPEYDFCDAAAPYGAALWAGLVEAALPIRP